MTPTFIGRLQSRFFLLLLVGVPWTLLVSPLLPSRPGLSATYATTFRALLIVLVAGLVLWEPIYHGLQQFRWEKDWPSLFGLVTMLNEGLLAWLLLGVARTRPPFVTFAAHFVTLWLLVWLMAIGPIRLFLLRYRFRGGKFVG